MDFKDLNDTPKDEYQMPVVEMLVNTVVGFKYLSNLYVYSS